MSHILEFDCASSGREEVFLGSLQSVESLKERVDVLAIWSELNNVEDIVRAGVMLKNSVKRPNYRVEILLLAFKGLCDIVKWEDVLFDLLEIYYVLNAFKTTNSLTLRSLCSKFLRI
jgi:hypothetical protein